MPSLDPTLLKDPSSNDEVLDAFLSYLVDSGIEPYDHQEEAILELFAGKNVILNTPTGSGKSLVALALQFRAICQGRRSYYTVPVKALANEKFLSLCKTFGPERVGMITGDATVNPGASVICCTAEILANHGESGGFRDLLHRRNSRQSRPSGRGQGHGRRGHHGRVPLLLRR